MPGSTTFYPHATLTLTTADTALLDPQFIIGYGLGG